MEKGTYSWHVPVVSKSMAKFHKLPAQDEVVKEITAFVSVKDNGVERAPAQAAGRAR